MADDKPVVTETDSGPVVQVQPGQSLDLGSDAPEFDPARVGSTPRTSGSAALVEDDSNVNGYDDGPHGDTPVPDHVGLVDVDPAHIPTAGELRAAGYDVPAKSTDAKGKPVAYADDEVPASFVSSTPTPPGEVHLVIDTTPADDGLTPNERAERDTRAANEAAEAQAKADAKAKADAESKAVEGSPENKAVKTSARTTKKANK